MVARAMYVMYYDQSCAWNKKRSDVARKQHKNYCSVAQRVTVNFVMTYTVHVHTYSHIFTLLYTRTIHNMHIVESQICYFNNGHIFQITDIKLGQPL